MTPEKESPILFSNTSRGEALLRKLFWINLQTELWYPFHHGGLTFISHLNAIFVLIRVFEVLLTSFSLLFIPAYVLLNQGAESLIPTVTKRWINSVIQNCCILRLSHILLRNIDGQKNSVAALLVLYLA